MSPNSYRDFLLSRILKENGFGTTKALLAAIKEADAIPEDSQWRHRKAAFNAIGEQAPLRDDSGYCLLHHEIPAFLDTEVKEFIYWKGYQRAVNRRAKEVQS